MRRGTEMSSRGPSRPLHPNGNGRWTPRSRVTSTEKSTIRWSARSSSTVSAKPGPKKPIRGSCARPPTVVRATRPSSNPSGEPATRTTAPCAPGPGPLRSTSSIVTLSGRRSSMNRPTTSPRDRCSSWTLMITQEGSLKDGLSRSCLLRLGSDSPRSLIPFSSLPEDPKSECNINRSVM